MDTPIGATVEAGLKQLGRMAQTAIDSSIETAKKQLVAEAEVQQQNAEMGQTRMAEQATINLFA